MLENLAEILNNPWKVQPVYTPFHKRQFLQNWCEIVESRVWEKNIYCETY